MKNTMRITANLILQISLSLFIYQGDLSACSCQPPRPPDVEYGLRSVVFIGVVRKIERDPTRKTIPLKITLDLVKTWKGTQSLSPIVYTFQDETACGYSFQKDTTYLIYADFLDDTLVTGKCVRTRKLSEAEEDLAFLNTLAFIHIQGSEQQSYDFKIGNYPNPANPSTTIRFSIPQPSFVTLKLFNICGKEVVTVLSGFCEQGINEISFDCSNLPSGFYISNIQTRLGSRNGKLLVIK